MSAPTAAAQTQNGSALFSDGQYPAAVKALQSELAQSPRDTDTLFLLGMSYQQLGDYAASAGALRRVLRLNPTYFDALLPLGIAYYRLSLWQNAESTLTKVTNREPNNGSAWLFLGLTQQAMSKDPAAISSYRRAADVDQELRQTALLNVALAQQRLGRIDKSQTTLRNVLNIDPQSDEGQTAQALLGGNIGNTNTERRWDISISAGAEYDDNVTTSENDVTTGEQDVAAIFDFSAAYRPLKTDQSEVELGYDFFQSLYSDLDDFDLRLHTLSALASHDLADVSLSGSYRYIDANLGGKAFFRFHDIRPSIGFASLENTFHSLSYSYQDKDFESDNLRDGNQHGVALDNFYFISPGYFVQGSFRFEAENTDGDQFDYDGYYGSLGLNGRIDTIHNRPAKVRFGYQYYVRDYRNVTPSIGDDRRDQRHTVSLNIRQPLWKSIAAILSYEYISADSNLPTSDFTNNVVSLSLEWAP